MLEKIHIYLSMFAALVTVIVGILTHKSLGEIAVPVIVAIIAFYFVGIAVQGYLNRTVFIKEEFTGAGGETAETALKPANDAVDDDLSDDDDNL